MRLRLTVQRNAIPAANVLWNVPETKSTQAYTISRLLEDVNHVIPLEAEHWGLEHYVVEVDGFECLHFSPVGEALKDNDHVSIRPLLTAEVRARTLTGRDQISEDGRHLVDGVPFGKPYLRHPRRPAIRIPASAEVPPRKRQRIESKQPAPAEDLDSLVEGILDAAKIPTLEQRQNEGSKPAEVQEIEQIGQDMRVAVVLAELLGLGGPQAQAGRALQVADGESKAASRSEHQANKGSKTVHFEQSDLFDDEDNSEEEDEDFTPDHVGIDEDMDDESEDDSDFETGSNSGASSASGSASSGSDSDSDDTTSDSGSESDAGSPPEIRSSKGRPGKGTTLEHIAPGQGLKTTRSRNARRTKSNRLRHLKESGKLPQDATLKDLAEYEGDHTKEATDVPAREPFSHFSGKRKRLNEDDEERSVSELEHRKQQLMTRFDEETASTMVQVEDVLQHTSTAPEVPLPKDESNEETIAEKETPKKRLRPDTSAISRILARQAMPSVKKSTKAKPAETVPTEPEGASHPDFWKSRINLSAFECWDEEFELGAPPFPFKQHWDPASKLMREKVEKKKKQKRGKKVVEEPLPIEEDEEEKIILDYDDAPAPQNPDSEIHEAIEDQLRQDVATAAQLDLPPLPDDMSTLPDLTSGDIKEGAVIICKFFAVNPITVTPEISDHKTAIVDREGDSGNGAGTIRLKLAKRDLPKRERRFDSKGNRIYDAADQFFMETEDEEEGLWEGQFGELLEPKLLKAA